MSDVYLALINSAGGVNKLLVVKQLRASLLDEPDALSMFMDEARLAARLHHPNVIQTFEVGQEGPLPYMTLEFLDGQPLHRILRRLGPAAAAAEPEDPPGLSTPVSTPVATVALDLALRLRIVTEMLEGLHYAHELRDYDGSPMRVVHRDVSPQNLVITYNGQVKLVDFGIAKASASITRTEGRGLKGKLTYMSPQQANGEDLDRRADVFAAGVILWELLSARRLWADTSEATIARRLVDHDLPPLELPGLPARLQQICRRALAPGLDDRYPSAEALRLDLERFMADFDLDGSAREIGRWLTNAFADERQTMRARIDRELLRDVEGGSLAAPPEGLWTGSTRGPAGVEPAIGSAEPDEVTADYGPADKLLDPVELVREPPREASGVIGVEASSLPQPPLSPSPSAPRSAPPRRREWAWPLAGGLSLGLAFASPLLLDLVQPTPSPDLRQDPEPILATTAVTSDDGPPPPSPSSLGQTSGCDTPTATKPRVVLSGEIDADATLTCDRNYVLEFDTRVVAGVTLTIEPGTVVLGNRETRGTLIVEPGARLVAEGTRERPIVFTSDRAPDQRRSGDWGGVVILGRAPTNLRDAEGRSIRGQVEGLAHAVHYGGDDPDDDSGVLRYVRIEYPGVEIAPANELNGLTLAGVGRGTTLDHIAVRHSSDDCFEFFGGTVDARYLVCDDPGDDAFDFDQGYGGRLQFLVVRTPRGALGVSHGGVSHGFEIDNDPNGTTAGPRTAPTIWNATLCGASGGRTPSYALLVRRAAQAAVHGLVISGFDHALDLRDADTELVASGLVLVDQSSAEPDEVDDDAGFDELRFMADPARAQVWGRRGPPDFAGCSGRLTSLLPPAAIVPDGSFSGPPDDGFFDAGAAYCGAFAGADDDWTAVWAADADADLGPRL